MISEAAVIKRMKSVNGFNDFISLNGRGYLHMRIYNTDILIFRESIGASYYFCYPLTIIDNVYKVNEFMRIALPWISKKLEDNRKERLNNNE